MALKASLIVNTAMLPITKHKPIISMFIQSNNVNKDSQTRC